ncbi:adenylate/guanylate cyclase domain-containing protein [Granulosicoccus sp. 3-233]|uniref:adenylate/guanylate cyclase domain-containing protein n=1 Tax=Granulosicoccus sp. 3-233 TaxID=3417969 RepID=UPI003D32E73C
MSTADLFTQEEQTIAATNAWLARKGADQDPDNRQMVESLLHEYCKLFKVTRRLLRVSDRNDEELRRLRNAAETAKATLSRYFSPNLAEQLVVDPDFLGLGGERRELTFLFTDIADFTALVETHDPVVTVPLLNEYLDNMTQIVFRHGGTTDKIVGDALHVIFGAPVEQPEQAASGLACALEIDAFSESFRRQKAEEGIHLGVTRIGLHKGAATVGNFGGEVFFNYTAYGDTVNTAARLESVNKHLGTRICASATVVDGITGFIGRPVGTLILKGKTSGLKVFEPLAPEQMCSSVVAAYNAAYEKLESDDPSAKQAFAAIVAKHGEDPLAIFHLVRLLAGDSGNTIVVDEK